MTFIRGVNLDSLDADSLTMQLTESSFTDIGRIFVLDVLLNNFDRIPGSIWKNKGNLGNLMSTNNGRIYGIDQALVTPNNEEAEVAYIEKVRCAFQGLMHNGLDCEMIDHVWKFISQYGNWVPQDSASVMKLALYNGMIDVIKKLTYLKSEKRIREIKESIEHTISIDWEYVWKEMCDCIDPRFVFRIISTIYDVYDQNTPEMKSETNH